MPKRIPTLSFCIATYNAETTMEDCLQSIIDQNYPREKMEIIVADGGSVDSTLEIAKKYGAKIIKVSADIQGAEYNKSVAINAAKNEILVAIDQDNILPHANWLRKMIKPLIEDSEIVGVEPIRYKYMKSLGFMDRYFALFGVNDPLPYYLGKADRISYHSNEYTLFGRYKDMGEYYKVEFSPDKVPTLGANGFLVRRKILMENARAGIGEYLHVDVTVDLIAKGFNTFAFVKDEIIHKTNSKGLFTFIKRRKHFMEKYYLQDFSKRRYRVFMYPQDLPRLIYFVIISITFVVPFFDSLRGFLVVHDIAWFVHPLLCFGMVVVYSYTVIKFHIKSLYEKILDR